MPIYLVLWAALTMSHVMLLGVANAGLFGEGPPPPVAVVGALAMGALGAASSSFILPSRLLAPVREEAFAALSDPMADREAVLKSFAPKLLTPFIMRLALCEVPSMFGVALATMHAPPIIVLAFGLSGLTLALVRFPTERLLWGGDLDAR